MTAKDLVAHSYEDVKLTIKEIINANTPLQKIAREKFPVVIAFKISKTLKALDKITEDFSKERRQVLDQLGKLHKETGQYTFEGDNENAAEEIVNKMLESEVTVKVLKIKLSELGPISLEPGIFALLDWYFIE